MIDRYIYIGYTLYINDSDKFEPKCMGSKYV